MNENDKDFLMRRNLTDAGLPEAKITEVLSLLGEGRDIAVRRILARHRTSLLNTVHENQTRIDCLDYLIYDMDHNNRRPDHPAKGI